MCAKQNFYFDGYFFVRKYNFCTLMCDNDIKKRGIDKDEKSLKNGLVVSKNNY